MSYSIQYGLARIPANRAIVILLFELVVAAIAAYFLAGETMRVRDWIGGAFIVAACLASARTGTKDLPERRTKPHVDF
jgi:drug/metabolite transporter (DMT)-like permease